MLFFSKTQRSQRKQAISTWHVTDHLSTLRLSTTVAGIYALAYPNSVFSRSAIGRNSTPLLAYTSNTVLYRWGPLFAPSSWTWGATCGPTSRRWSLESWWSPLRWPSSSLRTRKANHWWENLSESLGLSWKRENEAEERTGTGNIDGEWEIERKRPAVNEKK